MTGQPRQISLDDWTVRRLELRRTGLAEADYGGPLACHLADGDLRLPVMRYDDSAAALRLWNFLLTEEERLHRARAAGKKIVGVMKDLGTVPVMAFALPNVAAFYPDGAWWLPCLTQLDTSTLGLADNLGIDETFCPVRAMLGAFVAADRFPIPDLLTCSVGATCDDFSAIAQRLEALGHEILWWEMPSRRRPDPGEPGVTLPGGFVAPTSQVEFVQSELDRVRRALQDLAGATLTDAMLADGICAANRVRALLTELRRLTFTAARAPLPALELLIAEMLAIHFCSDRGETIAVLTDLLTEVRQRVASGRGFFAADAARVFWVNPVADLRLMNLLEECGGRICGTDYLFCHALDAIPEDVEPLTALARMALADPMVGPAADRADRICREIVAVGAEAVAVSRIPGASHCGTEGEVIARAVRRRCNIPTIEFEAPPVTDACETLRTRLEALVEIVKEQRRSKTPSLPERNP